MNKTNKILWYLITGIFVFIIGVWIYAQKPDIIKRTDVPVPKYINFEVVAQSVQPSIIKINCNGVSSYGVIIHPRGYVLTVNREQSAQVQRQAATNINKVLYLTTYSGETYSGELVKTDKKNGFSIVKIMADKEFTPVQQVSSGKTKPGDLLSSPVEEQVLISKVTKAERNRIYMDVFASASIDGAPMFNQNSELVGLYSVVPATGSIAAVSSSADYSGYVIPATGAKSLLTKVSELLPETAYTKQGLLKIKWLGASFVPNTEVNGTSLLVENYGKSVNIWQTAGIKPGDKIIKANNNTITGLIDLERTLPAFAQYKKVNFTVIRDGKEKVITVRIRKIVPPKKFLFIPAILVLIVFIIVYYMTYHNLMDMTVLFILGAVVITICGYYLDFYDWADEWRSVTDEMQIIYFFLTMNILSVILEEGGLFNYLGHKIIIWSGGDRWKMMLGICFITFFISLFVNTLTTVIVLLPLVFYVIKKQPGLTPKPYIIGMIIASNLGGASTMIGGFTNILIATQNHIGFTDFIKYMMPICILEFIILLVYFRISQRTLFAGPKTVKSDPLEELPQLAWAAGDPEQYTDGKYDFGRIKPIKNPKIVKRGLIILGILLIALIISEFLLIDPSYVAILGGVAGLVFGGVKLGTIFENLCYKDIFFFTGLFILVGAAESSGLLSWFGEIVVHLSFGNVLARCLLVMWMASISTAFFDCGPSTVLFLHIIMNFKLSAPNNMYFWALSLGVLAGSCATLTGATAGTVSANMLKDFLAMHKLPRIKTKWKITNAKLLETSGLSFREYSEIGVPAALISLVISSIYITVIYKLGL